jgi:hypothetical protein
MMRRLPEPKHYQVHGLCISSHYPLTAPELPSVPAEPDLVVDLEVIADPPRRSEEPRQFRTWIRGPAGAVLRFEATGDVLELSFERDASRLVVRVNHPEIDRSSVILGAAMGALLVLRGNPGLHATALARDGRALALAARPGTGKTTLSAALIADGMQLLNDDLVAVEIDGGRARVHAGSPVLRVGKDVVTQLGLPETILSSGPDDKLIVDAQGFGGGFCRSACSLEVLYLLAGRRRDLSGPLIRVLDRRTACAALGSHIYGAGWLGIAQRDLLNQCAMIAAHTRVCEVWLPENLDRIRSVGGIIAADFESQTPPAPVARGTDLP